MLQHAYPFRPKLRASLHRLRWGFAIFCLALLVHSAYSDWSPEIVLHTSPDDGIMGTAMAIDGEENVHIAFQHYTFWPNHPSRHYEGLTYIKFDNHGNVLAPEMVLNDSLDEGALDPQILLFGDDSLWVCWRRVHSTTHGQVYTFVRRTLSIDGNLQGPMLTWDGPPDSSAASYGWRIAAGADRKVALVWPSYPDNTSLLCDVRNPDGTFVLHRTMIWRSDWYGAVSGLSVDPTDTLQVIWNQQRHIWAEGVSGYTKRVDMAHPFDSAHVADSSVITPFVQGESWGAGGFVPPVDDSLMVFPMQGAGDAFHLWLDYLRIVRRADYSLVAQAPVSGMLGDAYVACFEPDHTLSVVIADHVGSPGGPWGWRFKRFSYPQLTVVEDTLLLHAPSNEFDYTKAYVVSPQGVRHLVYRHAGLTDFRLVYRFWRGDLSAENSKAVPEQLNLRVFPNPLNSSARISYSLARAERVSLDVYDVTGRLATTLTDGWQDAGAHEVTFNGAEIASGIYFVRLKTAQRSQVQKIVLIR